MRRRSGRYGDQGPLLALRSCERGREWYCGAARQGILPRGQGGAKVRAKVGRVNGSRRLPGGQAERRIGRSRRRGARAVGSRQGDQLEGGKRPLAEGGHGRWVTMGARGLDWESLVNAKLDRSSLLTQGGTNSRIVAATGPAEAAVATHDKAGCTRCRGWGRCIGLGKAEALGNGAGEYMALERYAGDPGGRHDERWGSDGTASGALGA